MTDCFIFCAKSNTFTKDLYVLSLLTFSLSSLSWPTNQTNEFGYSHTLINAPSTSPCLLYTLPISPIIIWSTRYYRVINAVDLSEDTNHVTKANFSWEFVQKVLSSASGFSSNYHTARNMCNIKWFLRNFIRIFLTRLMNFSKYIIIPKYLEFIYKDICSFIITLFWWIHGIICQNFIQKLHGSP